MLQLTGGQQRFQSKEDEIEAKAFLSLVSIFCVSSVFTACREIDTQHILLSLSEHVKVVTHRQLWGFMIYCFTTLSAISVDPQIQGGIEDIFKGHFLDFLCKGQST